MSNKEITIKFVFSGDEPERSVRDNPDAIQAVLAMCMDPAPEADFTARVHVAPRENDGRLDWCLTATSSAGRRTYAVRQNSFKGQVKFGPV